MIGMVWVWESSSSDEGVESIEHCVVSYAQEPLKARWSKNVYGRVYWVRWTVLHLVKCQVVDQVCVGCSYSVYVRVGYNGFYSSYEGETRL